MAALQLEAIAFNHDPTSATHDALNIRRNLAQPVIAPEWTRGASARFEDSVAAYALRETRGNALTIQAKFLSSDLTLTRVEVRAVSGYSLGQWPWNVSWPYFAAWLQSPGAGSSVLGDVEARAVEFLPNGETEFVLFELPEHQLERYGIGLHRVVWRWQFRQHAGQPWTTFAQSQHRIYTVVAIPTAPWQQDGYPVNTQLPWTEVLDYACQWARGAATTERAAMRATYAVYGLGPELLEYNCPNMGAPMYVSIDAGPPPYFFNCSAFLELLRGGVGRGRYVNCSDCATIVSTFANVLGCDLSQSRMGFFPQGFSINPIVPIGAIRWELPCGFWSGFGMHEVAWDGQCTEDDNVFDACLVIDNDLDPTRAPHSPLIPANIRFGRVGEGLYRDRLAVPLHRPNCQAWPTTRQRRIVI